MTTTISQIIPLKNGDRLDRKEFENRYDAMPHLKKAELIEGVVYMGSPVRVIHGTPHGQIIGWLFNYWVATPGVQFADNTTVRLDTNNEPQPDALLRIETVGQSTISNDHYVEGPPEFIAKIAASSTSYDLGAKLEVYQHYGVQEYLVWQVAEQKIDWVRWKRSRYVSLVMDKTGTIKSEVFPGLWLNIPALIQGNLLEVISVLDMGLRSSEHQTFIEELKKRA